MDYQYDFRQAYQNRLEETGVVQYRAKNGFRPLRQDQRQLRLLTLTRRIHTNLLSAFTR